ncbi:MAG TPA: TonB-dependent receptor, partial [Thermoanaerobaculia bacterium]|nr:TonB-dependent receptor [Thermoanaerobaculia bacterium]
QGCPPAQPWVETVTFGSLSSQLRAEMNASFDQWERLKVVAGAEMAKSSIQSQVDQKASGPGILFHSVATSPEQIEHTDVALYAQGSWKPRPWVKLVFAGRVSHNEINNKPGAAGYGTLFTPRAGVILSPTGKHIVLKAIYSEAFKDPTDAEKFGVLAGVNEYPSFGLKPERVRNGELSAAWEPSERFSADASLYRASYSNVVGFDPVGGCFGAGCLRYANRDRIVVTGLQTDVRYHAGATEWWGNYTHTDPRLTNPDDARFDSLPVADIAGNRLNAGIDVRLRDRWNAGLRAHYVGERRTGQGTTDAANPFTRMPPYTTADAAVSDRRLIPRATLQLGVDNLFDKQYYDPATDPLAGAPRVLQAGRTVYLRLIVTLR